MHTNLNRIAFPPGRQRQFLERVRAQLGVGWNEVAACCGVHPRTIRDWHREKYAMSESALIAIRERLGIDPIEARVVPPYRHVRTAGRIGALARYQIYGNPGTDEGRSKGGSRSQERFRLDPGYAQQIGVSTRNSIKYPGYSPELAEFVGIMLGDGHVSRLQLRIYFNSKNEWYFAHFVQKLILNLFGLRTSLRDEGKHCIKLIASGINLVEFMERIGLRVGNKIRQQVGVPSWIFNCRDFMVPCLRGLMDTDGGVFLHNHVSGGHRYQHLGLCFTSYSPVLLQDVKRLFESLEYRARTYPQRGHIFLYRRAEVERYMTAIGSRHPARIKQFGEVSELAERARLESV